jgi:4-hydroxybenzoate polyprenyltransferase
MLLWLVLYLCLTICYSFVLKKYMILDVLVLAGLYTIRIMLGAAALGVTVSSWLLTFSMFVFLSLAFVKRSAEIIAADGAGRKEVSGRGYTVLDNSMVCSMGVASGYMSVLVLALFIDSQEATLQYSRPFALWLLCPLILYWISRLWMKTSRGEMHDDPLVYSLKDRASWIILAGMVVVTLLAI